MNKPDWSLYLVTDRELARGRPLSNIIRESVAGGVTIVQLREKDLAFDEFLRVAREVKDITDALHVPLIVNDRLDVALACGAAGIHVGQDDLSCTEARKLAGDRMIVGVSVNTVAEALRAESDGADYLGVSPIYATPTKTDTPTPTGLEGLRKIREAVRIPLVAIGGIGTFNAAEVIRAGADGLAVVSAIVAAPDPRLAARELRAAIEIGRRSRAN